MLATPYFQERYDSVPSTQDVARQNLRTIPLLVTASAQTRGRGRSGAPWETADRAVAASLAMRLDVEDTRPLSLMAGVAATFAVPETRLKWPNDVLSSSGKVGGILVERSDGVTVVGLGLNLFWPQSPTGSASLYETDPGESAAAEVAALWAAELMELVASDDWPIDAYREACSTLGKAITWEPDGEGTAVDVDTDGALVVETPNGIETLHSGTIHHIRTS